MDSDCPICLFCLLPEIQGGSQNGSPRKISFHVCKKRFVRRARPRGEAAYLPIPP